jgi:formiminoglutamase
MPPIPYLVPSSAVFRTPIPDPNNPRAGDWVRQWDGAQDLASVDVAIIGAPLSRSSLSHSGAFLLPRELRRVLLDFSTYFSDEDVDLSSLTVVDVGDIGMVTLEPVASHDRIEMALASLYAAAPLVIVIGGDHSITRPALSARARVAGAPLGLIQFDAHHDVRVLDNGPNNGTPVRGAIEKGALQANAVAQIGIHGFSNAVGYAAWARSQGIGVYTMRDVRQRGILSVVEMALAQARSAPGGVYVTVDMDVLDRAFAPGCPASSPGGMATTDLVEALFWLGQQDNIVGFDVVEVDPTRDIADMTVKATCLAFLAFLAGRVRGRSYSPPSE